MKKLAFECAGSFEMPKLSVMNLEKENNIRFASFNSGLSVYKGGKSSFTKGQMRSVAASEKDVLQQMLSNGTTEQTKLAPAPTATPSAAPTE